MKLTADFFLSTRRRAAPPASLRRLRARGADPVPLRLQNLWWPSGYLNPWVRYACQPARGPHERARSRHREHRRTLGAHSRRRVGAGRGHSGADVGHRRDARRRRVAGAGGDGGAACARWGCTATARRGHGTRAARRLRWEVLLCPGAPLCPHASLDGGAAGATDASRRCSG